MTNKEKLKKIKELADAMYNKMQNLTTDTLGIRKAMEEYHQFVIQEYYKEEPVSEDLEEVSKKYSSCIYLEEVLSDNDKEVLKERLINTFKAGVKWQKEKEEPINEDLGLYINELSKQFPEVSFAKLSRIAVRVAKWQKEYLLKLPDGNDLSESISENLEKAAREYSCIRSAENIDEYAEYDFEKYNAFKAGAEWKEGFVLTWEDINRIEIIIKDVYRDYPHGIEAKQFGIEVLSRFNKQKGKNI